MIRTFLFLELASWKNALRQRLSRLRNPRYLISAIVGIAYFYFFFLRHAISGRGPGGDQASPYSLFPFGGSDAAIDPTWLAGAIVTVILALYWLVPKSKAAPTFSEAEVAFLFPAPVSRRTLLHYRLLKSQLRILIGAAVLTLVRGRFGGGMVVPQIIGWWIIIATINLHIMGAAFSRDRLLGAGVGHAMRRAIVTLVLVSVVGLTVWRAPEFANAVTWNGQGVSGFVETFAAFLQTPPLCWLLFPARLLVGPMLAPTFADFVGAWGPAMLVAVPHYFWVIGTAVAFEEASVERSEKRTAVRARLRSQGGLAFSRQGKARKAPFRLASTGPRPIAFFWNGLLRASSVWYPKNWIRYAVVTLGFIAWLASDPARASATHAVAAVCAGVGAYGLVVGPLFSSRGLGRFVNHLDIIKTLPLRGWQVILGQMITPVALLCFFEWLVLSVLVLLYGMHALPPGIGPGEVMVIVAGAALLVPPLALLLFSVPLAALLYLPAWTSTAARQPHAGIEAMGQRLIFFAGYLIVLLVALLPSALVGGGCFFAIQWLTDLRWLALGVGTVISLAVMGGEVILVLWWLGHRFERFDLSEELPR